MNHVSGVCANYTYDFMISRAERKKSVWKLMYLYSYLLDENF
jgi:hypothetical protein